MVITVLFQTDNVNCSFFFLEALFTANEISNFEYFDK